MPKKKGKKVSSKRSSIYGKKPLWHWILIYLILGSVVYGAIYYFAFNKNKGYSYSSSYESAPIQQSSSALEY